ncbi:MAG: DUF4321 domain-containing protein [Peptococcaceae bacterium]|nr:DUF4321 domain-containing protein [Peptococcaceae bacterium]
MAKNPASIWLLIIFLIIGGLAGSFLGQLLAPTFPVLDTTNTIGIRPGVLDLRFLTITFGFSIAVGPLTVLGFILGYLMYRKV